MRTALLTAFAVLMFVSVGAAADEIKSAEPIYLQGSAGELYTVPADKILVIETVHGCGDLVNLTIPAGLMMLSSRAPGDTNPNFNPSNPWIPIRIESFPAPADSPRYDNYACSAPRSLRLYVSSGYTLLFHGSIAGSSVPGGSSARIAVFGYLLPSDSKTLSP